MENNPIISDLDELAQMDMRPQNVFAGTGGGSNLPRFWEGMCPGRTKELLKNHQKPMKMT